MPFALIFLGIAIAVSMIIVRIASVALEMTGMDREAARFQALSAFTGTGFTTREAEDVMRHPQRRRIVSVLILLGYAGVVTLIAGLLQALLTGAKSESDWELLRNLALLVVAAILLYQFIVWPRLAARLDRSIRAGLRRGLRLEPARVEELLTAAEGWAIIRFEVPAGCRFADHSLAESRLRDQGMLVLAIERGETLIPSPRAATVILPGDVLLAYGRLETMEQLANADDLSGLCELPQDAEAEGDGAAPSEENHP
jgi:NhaP-type Na+/H+ or K+/H+ antiporter